MDITDYSESESSDLKDMYLLYLLDTLCSK